MIMIGSSQSQPQSLLWAAECALIWCTLCHRSGGRHLLRTARHTGVINGDILVRRCLRLRRLLQLLLQLRPQLLAVLAALGFRLVSVALAAFPRPMEVDGQALGKCITAACW